MLKKAKKLIWKICKISLISKNFNEYGKILETGIIWVLVQKIEDFHIDWYCFYPWSIIENIVYNKQQKFFEEMYNELPKNEPKKLDKIWLDDFESLFSQIKNKLLIIDKKNEQAFFWKIVTINPKYITIKTFDSYARREKKERKIQYKDIFCVSFDNEYLNVFEKKIEKID